MKSVLFNSHDIVLALVIVLSFLLAFRVRPAAALSRAGRILLPLFFVLYGFVAIDTLLFWGDAIKFSAFNVFTWLPMVFSFASFAIGPVIYWAFRSVLWPEKPIKLTDYLQLLPALATFPYLYWACYRYPFEQQTDLILNLSIFSDVDVHFMTFLTLKKLMPVIYGFLCMRLLFRKTTAIAEKIAGIGPLLQLYTGFVFIWFWILLTHVLGQWLPLASSDLMGIFGNYMSLTLVAALTFKSLEYPAQGKHVDRITEEPEAEENNEEIAALSERIHKFIHTEKPYLNPRLTLERFAALLQVSPRHVSLAINRCFEQNFHEYINGFRVEEAKRLLRNDIDHERTILDIAQQSGFNSKATFNRIFKLLTDVTPSAYRQQFRPELTPHQPHC